VQASHFKISPLDAVGSAARRAIAFHYSALMHQVSGASAGEIEPIHQVRVSTRRLRAVIRLFAPYLSAIKPREIDRELKWISSQAGNVREVDVIENLARKRARELAAALARSLDPLWEELRNRRQHAVDELAAALESRRFKILCDRLGSPVAITVHGDSAFASAACGLAAPIVKSMIRQGERLPEDPRPADLHKLRVRAKRCRYALETMTGLGDKRIEKMLAKLEGIQDVLGRYHDAVVASQWIAEFVRTREITPEVAFACGALAESICRRERKLKRAGLDAWQRLRQRDPEQTVLKALRGAKPQGNSSDDAVHHAPRNRRGSQPGGRRRSAQTDRARA
jgi:CHAD domain-containing protein